jgi:signal transduction histidine kinase
MMATHSQLLARKYRGRLDGDADQVIRYIVEGAQRMQALIGDLLAYSRVTQATGNRPLLPVDMNRSVDAAMMNLTASIEESGAVITCDTLPAVSGNSLDMIQLFENLLSNAIRYGAADRGPVIHVSARTDGGHFVFAVRDNGIGIAPAYHEQIFGIFKRLSRSQPGTGIGLALCRRIVEKLNGRIWVESDEGKGSTFLFTLPAAIN